MDPAQGLAGRGVRLGAGVIDLIILGVVGRLLAFPFGTPLVFTTNPGGSLNSVSVDAIGAFGGLIEFVVFVAYFTILHSKWEGQTVGKKALGIRVVREADHGAVSVGQAFGRALFYYFAWWVCFIGGLIDLGWILGDQRHQALHDKVVKTVVASAKPGEPNPYRTGHS